MKEDASDLAAINLPTGARSIKVGRAAGGWKVFSKVNYDGNSGHVKQGVNYPNPKEMGLERDQAVMSLKRVWIVTRIHFQGSVDEFSRQTICESNLIKLKELA